MKARFQASMLDTSGTLSETTDTWLTRPGGVWETTVSTDNDTIELMARTSDMRFFNTTPCMSDDQDVYETAQTQTAGTRCQVVSQFVECSSWHRNRMPTRGQTAAVTEVLQWRSHPDNRLHPTVQGVYCEIPLGERILRRQIEVTPVG